jgi:O-antigen ligase
MPTSGIDLPDTGEAAMAAGHVRKRRLGTSLARERPVWLLLLVMLLIMPFEASPYLYISPSFLGIIPDFTMIKLLGMIGFMWAMLKIVTRESGPIFESPQARLFVALFIGIVISAALNESTFAAIAKYLVFVLFLPFVLVSVRTHENLRRIMYTLGLTMVIVIPYALRQTARYQGRMGVGLYEPNYLAANLLLLIPIPLAIASYQTIPWKRYAWLGACGVLTMGLILTSSRGGYLGLLAAGLVYAYRRRGLRAAFGVLALLILAALPTDLGRRAGAAFDPEAPPPPGVEESNQAHRALLWGGLKMVHDAPLFGVGPQRFKDYSRRYSGLKIPYIAHNTYLELSSEAGLPVLLLFLFMYLTAITVLGRAARLTGGPETRELAAWAEALRTGLIGFAIAGGFISAQFEKFFWVIIFLSIVVGRLAQQHAAASTEARAPAPAPPVPSRFPRFA